MVYAISGLGDSSGGCDLIPRDEASRTGAWAELRSKYGCPERIYPFWFFPKAPTLGISLSETWFLQPVTEEARRAQAAWRTKHPSDWYTPPYVQDYGSPDIKSGTQTNIPTNFWAGIPSTPIPCQCEATPGFDECKNKALQSVREKCAGNSECINSNFSNFQVMASCAVLCKNVPCKQGGGPISKADEEILNKMQQQQTDERKDRSRKTMVYALAGVAAFLFWQRTKKRK